MKPIRIQRRRTKGWRMPENTVSVCRPGKWGNPWKINKAKHADGAIEWVVETSKGLSFFKTKEEAQEAAVSAFRKSVEGTNNIFCIKHHLKGKNLACYCAIGTPCHADVLLEIANREEGA